MITDEDITAHEGLVRRVAWRMRHLCSVVGSMDELRHLARIGVMRGLQTFQPGSGKRSSWLFRQAQYAIQNAARSITRKDIPAVALDAELGDPALGGEDPAPSDRDHAAAAVALLRQRASTRNFAKLTPTDVEVLVRWFNGEQFTTIGRALGFSTTRAWQCLPIAMRRARLVLETAGFEP